MMLISKININKFISYWREGNIFYALRRACLYLIFIIGRPNNNKINRIETVIKKDNLKIICSPGRVNIYWKDNLVSEGVGFNTSCCVLKTWHSCTQADWQIRKISPVLLEINTRWWNIPLSQQWQIEIKTGRKISWRVEMKVEEDLQIEERKAGLMLKGEYQEWFTENQSGEFPPLSENNWQEINLENILTKQLGVKSIGFLPQLVINFADIQQGEAQVQTSPQPLLNKLLQIRMSDKEGKKEYLPGRYPYFEASLIIREDIENDRNGEQKEIKGHKRNEFYDLLLVLCPPWDVSMPPLGVAYLSGYLRKYGYKTSIFDLNVSLYNSAKDEIKYLWEQKNCDFWVDDDLFQKTWSELKEITIRNIKGTLKDINTEYIGLSVNFAGIKFAAEILGIIKRIQPQAKIILGGWGCVNGHMRSLYPKELIDVFVVGEGEETLLKTLEALKGHKAKRKVPGAIFNKNGKPRYEPRPSITNLDSIPWPTYNEFDLNLYKYRILPLFTSRGCIGNCSFCNDCTLTEPYRFRSAQNIFEEIKYHVENNQINCFSFKDLLCNGNIRELNLLCDLIINSKLKISWDSQAIARQEMNYELLQKLKKSGCSTLIYGIESFSNNVLRKMRKIFTKEIAERVLRDTHQAGINSCINIIVGFPQETEEDLDETLEAIKRNREYINQIGAVSVCLVNNDSDLDINTQKYGIIMPQDPKIRAKHWYTMDGRNTYEIRKRRAEKVIKLVEQLGLSCSTSTI